MKTALRKLGHAARNRYTQAGAGMTALLVAGTANASDPTGAEAAIAAMETEAQATIDAAWPFLVTVLGATIGMKLIKKFANRAS
ncbi:major coat protein [Halomonas koreensis]|uniref:Phage major coat protein, Gp8 n=1 Tax=Halomonas koreensis TaxID=245385 RepID=A0ABU1FXR8_9GAMM|nr:major coat protein [Halomonas koreensis]MDR5865276.1 hypothetical protein [Halomonas koreensis]